MTRWPTTSNITYIVSLKGNMDTANPVSYSPLETKDNFRIRCHAPTYVLRIPKLIACLFQKMRRIFYGRQDSRVLIAPIPGLGTKNTSRAVFQSRGDVVFHIFPTFKLCPAS